MNKRNVVDILLNEIVKSELISCCFTNEAIYDEIASADLYCITSSEKLSFFVKYQNDFLYLFDNLIHSIYKNNCLTGYYEDGTIINIYCYSNFDFTVYGKIVPLFDPYNLLSNFKSRSFAYTNLEFAKKIDEFCCVCFEYYDICKQNDKIAQYRKALDIQELFIQIYRIFYDSLNSKKGSYGISKTMNSKYVDNLVNFLKLFKFDYNIDAVKIVMNEINKIVDCLPVNVVSLFNIDFYNFTKKLIYSL